MAWLIAGIILSVITGLATSAASGRSPAYPPISPAQQATAVRILSMNVVDLRYCESDSDCTPNKPLCQQMTRLCISDSEAEFDFIYGSCEMDGDCQPMYRCHGKKCHFSGPKACESGNDCLSGHAGLTFTCKSLLKSAPGKRCWLSCSKDRDCHECDDTVCRLPEELQNKISCCEGFCQRTVACSNGTLGS